MGIRLCVYVSCQDNVKTARGPIIILEVGSLAVVQAGEVFLAARGGLKFRKIIN